MAPSQQQDNEDEELQRQQSEPKPPPPQPILRPDSPPRDAVLTMQRILQQPPTAPKRPRQNEETPSEDFSTCIHDLALAWPIGESASEDTYTVYSDDTEATPELRSPPQSPRVHFQRSATGTAPTIVTLQGTLLFRPIPNSDHAQETSSSSLGSSSMLSYEEDAQDENDATSFYHSFVTPPKCCFDGRYP